MSECDAIQHDKLDAQAVPRIKGIFSHRQDESISYWFAKENQEGDLELRALDDDYMPQGPTRKMDRETFLKSFFLEPERWYRLVTQRLTRGEAYRKKNMHLEAKIEYTQVIAVDEDNIKAHFGLGMSYMALGELEKARYVFEKIVSMDESFLPVHKHLFNAFGIALRKNSMYRSALRYYKRAEELAQEDENIFLNIARVHFEQKNYQDMFTELRKTLESNLNHVEANAFLTYLQREEIISQDKDQQAFFEDVRQKVSMRKTMEAMFADTRF